MNFNKNNNYQKIIFLQLKYIFFTPIIFFWNKFKNFSCFISLFIWRKCQGQWRAGKKEKVIEKNEEKDEEKEVVGCVERLDEGEENEGVIKENIKDKEEKEKLSEKRKEEEKILEKNNNYPILENNINRERKFIYII